MYWTRNRKSTSAAMGVFLTLDAVKNITPPPNAQHFRVVVINGFDDEGHYHTSTPWLDYPASTPWQWVEAEGLDPLRVSGVLWDTLYPKPQPTPRRKRSK